MSYRNLFHELLMQLSEEAGWVLQLVHDTRGAHLAELEPELSAAKISQADQHPGARKTRPGRVRRHERLENDLDRRRREQLADAIAICRRRPGGGRT